MIESVWQRLMRELQNSTDSITSAVQLKSAIQSIWKNLPADYIQLLYKSIPRRQQTILKANDRVTKY